MKAWQLHEYGAPRDVLRLEDVPTPEPGPREIRVRVAAITLNYNDLDGITGRYLTIRPPLPYIPGMEVLGRVEAAGPGAEDFLGKRVCAIPNGGFGGYAEQAVCPAACTFEMPADIRDVEAAAVFFPFHLSWYSLFDRGRLARGESVLIHAAAGGVGSAAVQLARAAGARVFATAGSDDKLALCRELGADVAINYTTEDFAEVVLRETDNRGVDVVFDNVGDAVWAASVKSTAYNGRYVMMGAASDKTKVDVPFVVPRQVIAANIKLCGALLAYATPDVAAFVKQAVGYNFAPRELGEEIMATVIDLVRAGEIRPVIGSVVGFDDLPAAIDAMARRETTGRTIILVGQ